MLHQFAKLILREARLSKNLLHQAAFNVFAVFRHPGRLARHRMPQDVVAAGLAVEDKAGSLQWLGLNRSMTHWRGDL